MDKWKILGFSGLIAIVLTIPVTVLLVKNQRAPSSSEAAQSNAYEAESATLSGPATIGNDSAASAGKYVVFSSTATTTPTPTAHPPTNPPTNPPSPTPGTPAPLNGFQPNPPYYTTFFYLWFQNPNTDSGWGYWTDHGGNPPNTWFSHYIPDPNPSALDPPNELYSASNYNNFKWQAGKLKEAKISVAIASWWGQGTREDGAFNNIINSFMGRSDNPYPRLRWAMYYENEGFSDPSVSQLVSDLNYIKAKYVGSQYLLRVNGKPVMFVYAGANDAGGMAQRWKDANAQVGNTFYTVLKVYGGSPTDPNQPDAWHQYAPAARSGSGPGYYFVSPGFWLDDGSAERLPRNPTDFEAAVRSMVSANVTWKLIETWNEWGEGTSVEPGEQVRTNTGTGKDEIDPNGYQFGNLYIDILNRNLPALQ